MDSSHSHKKRRLSEKPHSSKKDKGKSRMSGTYEEPTDSPFLKATSRIRLSVPPIFAADIKRGVDEMLDSLIMRYSPALDAVLLAYSRVTFADNTCSIINDSPFAICDVWFDAVLWAPKVGMRLSGIHSISSPSHISLILNRTFNVSIPIENIPQDIYSFEETPDDEILAESSQAGMNVTGRWRDGRSGRLVGEGREGVVFTVTGMQVTNQILSLTGSLIPSGNTGHQSSSSSALHHSIPPAPGTQLAKEVASRPSTSTNPAHLANPGKTSLAIPKPKKSKTNDQGRTQMTGVDVASADDVNNALHDANPGVQANGAPDIEDEEARKAAKAKRKAEKHAKKEAKRAKASHEQTAAQAEERAGAMIDVKMEYMNGSAEDAPVREKKKEKKRAAEGEAGGEKATKRKKV